jgi:hypothetical protein
MVRVACATGAATASVWGLALGGRPCTARIRAGPALTDPDFRRPGTAAAQPACHGVSPLNTCCGALA